MRHKFFLLITISLVFLMIFFNCSNPRSFDIILYDNHEYEETNVEDILMVSSRLKIPEKYFEIGVIKATKGTQISYVKEQAAKEGAEIIINEGNLNFTLARYKFSKKEKKDETNSIKT